jgi:hypothetical protein
LGCCSLGRVGARCRGGARVWVGSPAYGILATTTALCGGLSGSKFGIENLRSRVWGLVFAVWGVRFGVED